MNFQLISFFCYHEVKTFPHTNMLSMLSLRIHPHSSKPHTAIYLNELLTALMNISFFFMEPFNSPSRGNDILSKAST